MSLMLEDFSLFLSLSPSLNHSYFPFLTSLSLLPFPYFPFLIFLLLYPRNTYSVVPGFFPRLGKILGICT